MFCNGTLGSLRGNVEPHLENFKKSLFRFSPYRVINLDSVSNTYLVIAVIMMKPSITEFFIQMSYDFDSQFMKKLRNRRICYSNTKSIVTII